jgi:nucleoside-diphosphate-sugar epimerase
MTTNNGNQSANRQSRLLVTGAPGWLADSFLRSLEREPLDGVSHVRCLVHPSVPLDAQEQRRRWGYETEIARGDLLDTPSLERAVQGVDLVVHAAAIMHVRRIAEYYAVNSQGTRSLARSASRAGVRRFVYLSTNAAAGRSSAPDRLVRESDPDRPLSHYGRSKWLGERWLFDSAGPMECTVIRPCMFYGPPVPPRHVDVYRRVRSSRMPLVGGGGYARSLTHIDNLVQGVRLALRVPQAVGQVYNVADRDPYTTKQVVDAMARALGVEPRYIPLPAVAADVAYRVDSLLSTLGRYHQTTHLVGEATWNVGVSIDKARDELGYRPQVGIDEGMRGTTRPRPRAPLSRALRRLAPGPVEEEEPPALHHGDAGERAK